MKHSSRNNDMDVLSRKSKLGLQRGPQLSSLYSLQHLAALVALVFSWTLLGTPAPVVAEQPANQQTESPEDAQPYVVFVAEEAAYTRCGPGDDHYRTERLRRGQELEVYVETADGWLGIRPLEESFCWMPASAVEISDDELTGRIREDKTLAWIGTNLGQARRYRWQVQLDAGEQVSIMGKTDRKGTDGTKTWLRIVPPPGEFRWIHRDHIAESAEELARRVAHSVADKAAAQGKPNNSKIATVALQTSAEPNASSEDETPHLVPIRDAKGTPRPDPNALTDPVSPQPVDAMSSRRGEETETLREAEQTPELRPAPAANNDGASTNKQRERLTVNDKPFQLHRGVPAEAFEDRGAVIGSGLRDEWKEDSMDEADPSALAAKDSADEDSDSVLNRDRLADSTTSGAAAAAKAISAPFRKVTDVVANFISPPRLVEIDPQGSNAFEPTTPVDRRWMVGSSRPSGSQAPFPPPQSLSVPQQPIRQASAEMAVDGLGETRRPTRIVTVAQIARVEDAVSGADVDTVGQVLSKLMAEAASADEIDPLIRRAETLLQSGDVSRATRTRDVLDLAQRYRNIAARRDGATTIHSTSLAIETKPIGQSGANDQGSTDSSNAALVQQAAAQAPLVRGSLGLPEPAADTGTATGAVTSTGWSASNTPAPQPIETPLGPVVGTATGYLVQVYSTRANSPPYALTDDAGLTVAYVTPYPGVNLRNHLNSKISVSGNEKLLEGMSTPHLLVDRAVRR